MCRKLLLFVALLGVPFLANARDTKQMYDVQPVIDRAIAEGHIDGSVKFYFGNTPHPAVTQQLGPVRSNKKTNAFGKSDAEACEWVFISVLIALNERAKDVGANAVINILSNYRDQEKSDDSRFECGAGALIAGAAVKGELVKVE